MGKVNADDFNDTVLSYYNELANKKPLPREEEDELISLAKTGDENAKNKIIESNLRFVFNVAKKYKGNGVPMTDLISDGNMGLIKALDKFDMERGVKFITYAVFWVKQAMIQSIKEHFLKGMVEETTDVMSQEIYDVCEEQYMEDGAMFDMPNKDVACNVIDNAMSCLTPRERSVIEMNYGMNGYSELSLKDIGDSFGITGERIRRIKQKAIRKMRAEVMSNDSFFEN